MSYVLHVKANSLSYNQAAQANLLRFPVSSQQKTIAAMNDHGIQVLCLPSCIRRVGYQNTGALERLDLLNNLPLCTTGGYRKRDSWPTLGPASSQLEIHQFLFYLGNFISEGGGVGDPCCLQNSEKVLEKQFAFSAFQPARCNLLFASFHGK
jgi:hypothetical protein